MCIHVDMCENMCVCENEMCVKKRYVWKHVCVCILSIWQVLAIYWSESSIHTDIELMYVCVCVCV